MATRICTAACTDPPQTTQKPRVHLSNSREEAFTGAGREDHKDKVITSQQEYRQSSNQVERHCRGTQRFNYFLLINPRVPSGRYSGSQLQQINYQAGKVAIALKFE
jgi:bifunctional pyridoxal-dependent enzyme with beta-cystathionase and maltose regulon repressor activities